MPLTPSARDGGQILDHDGPRDLLVGALHVLPERDLAVVRGPRRARNAAFAQGRVAHGLHRLARRPRIADVRELDALHAHVQQAQVEGGIEAGRRGR